MSVILAVLAVFPVLAVQTVLVAVQEPCIDEVQTMKVETHVVGKGPLGL